VFGSRELRDETEAISLTIDAPDGAESVLGDIVAAFGGHNNAA
jgi:hypothetical protein